MPLCVVCCVLCIQGAPLFMLHFIALLQFRVSVSCQISHKKQVVAPWHRAPITFRSRINNANIICTSFIMALVICQTNKHQQGAEGVAGRKENFALGRRDRATCHTTCNCFARPWFSIIIIALVFTFLEQLPYTANPQYNTARRSRQRTGVWGRLSSSKRQVTIYCHLFFAFAWFTLVLFLFCFVLFCCVFIYIRVFALPLFVFI